MNSKRINSKGTKPNRNKSRRNLDGQTIFLGSVIVATLVLFGYLALLDRSGQASNNTGNGATARELTLDDIPFDGESAYAWMKAICKLGPRPSGSTGMTRQQDMLGKHFRALGGEVEFQRFRTRHPENGQDVQMANLIVRWHPQRKERVLLAAHYDTRPFPDRDRRNKRGVFVGANDGASGVAVLCELARAMPKLDGRYGVDFVLFDAEEFVFDDRRDGDRYFMGSTHFAREYVANPPLHRYRYGVLLDMVGDARLNIYQERNSMTWRDTRPLVKDIWNTARRLGVKNFIHRVKHEIRDDHLPLHDIAGIPTCDIIDFDYPSSGIGRSYWHTEADTPDKCSALSLAKVGWVMQQWLSDLK